MKVTLPRRPNALLTSTQLTTLRVIDKLWQKHGEPPGLRLISKALGMSELGAQHIVRALREKGYLGEGAVRVSHNMKIMPKGRKALT